MSDFERDEFLEKEFDFSNAIKNPYAKVIKKPLWPHNSFSSFAVVWQSALQFNLSSPLF